MNHKRIKRIRERLGLTQDEAAKRAGIRSKQHWSNIETGRQDSAAISVDLLERIASALEVKPAELLK